MNKITDEKLNLLIEVQDCIATLAQETEKNSPYPEHEKEVLECLEELKQRRADEEKWIDIKMKLKTGRRQRKY